MKCLNCGTESYNQRPIRCRKCFNNFLLPEENIAEGPDVSPEPRRTYVDVIEKAFQLLKNSLIATLLLVILLKFINLSINRIEMATIDSQSNLVTLSSITSQASSSEPVSLNLQVLRPSNMLYRTSDYSGSAKVRLNIYYTRPGHPSPVNILEDTLPLAGLKFSPTLKDRRIHSNIYLTIEREENGPFCYLKSNVFRERKLSRDFSEVIVLITLFSGPEKSSEEVLNQGMNSRLHIVR